VAYIFSSIALLVSVISFFYLRRYVTKRTTVERIPQDTREAVNQILNDIDRITDRDSLLVEERVRKLKALLEETDKRLAVLIKEQEARKTGSSFFNTGYAAYAAHAPQAAARAPQTPAGEDAVGEAAVHPPQAAAGKAARPQPAPAEEAEFDLFKVAEYTAQAEANVEYVPAESAAQLQAQGLSTATIAARLGKSVTEVEMELFLAQKQ
jgi:hypothetical protein